MGEALRRGDLDCDVVLLRTAAEGSLKKSSAPSSWAWRRVRGRRVAELFLEVTEGRSVFMAQEAEAVGILDRMTFGEEYLEEREDH